MKDHLSLFDDIKKHFWTQSNQIAITAVPEHFYSFGDGSVFEWAMAMAAADPRLKATAMKNVLKGVPEDEKGMMYLSRGEPENDKIRQIALSGPRENLAVQLQSDGLNRKHPPLQAFIEKELVPILNQKLPLGYNAHSSLWITGEGHAYDRHVDLGDHILIQLCGKKRIKFNYMKQPFERNQICAMNFRELPERFEGEAFETVLEPGQMAFFSRGILHDISIDEGPSVSISMGADYLYPLLTFARQMNDIAQNEVVQLKDQHMHWDKFRATLFDPNYFVTEHGAEGKFLLWSLLQSVNQKPETQQAKQAYEIWWQNFAEKQQVGIFSGLPTPPANKNELLKQWEKERIEQLNRSAS